MAEGTSVIPRNPSAEFMRLNPHLFPVRETTVKKLVPQIHKALAHRESPARGFVFRIKGQVRGGKNAMGITRTGRHYARGPFKKWRDEAVCQLRGQMPSRWIPLAEPCNISLDYVSGDRRRRDMPAILDAVWHVLEKAGIVRDDTFLWVSQSSRQYDPENPGVRIIFL